MLDAWIWIDIIGNHNPKAIRTHHNFTTGGTDELVTLFDKKVSLFATNKSFLGGTLFADQDKTYPTRQSITGKLLTKIKKPITFRFFQHKYILLENDLPDNY